MSICACVGILLISQTVNWFTCPRRTFTCDRTSCTIVSANPCWQAYMSPVQPPLRRLRSFDLTPLIGASFTSFVPLWFKSMAHYFHQHVSRSPLLFWVHPLLYHHFSMQIALRVGLMEKSASSWAREEVNESFFPSTRYIVSITAHCGSAASRV